MADLPDGHMLAMYGSEDVERVAECRDGAPVGLQGISSPMSDEEFKTWQAVANLLVWDAFRRREAETFRAIVSEGPGNFTGLLGVLKGDQPR